jgi:hypothetical protein
MLKSIPGTATSNLDRSALKETWCGKDARKSSIVAMTAPFAASMTEIEWLPPFTT